MINLIKNELVKIFHKKSIYILTIILTILTAIIFITMKNVKNNLGDDFSENYEIWDKEYKEFGKITDENVDDYINVALNRELLRLRKKYNDPESYEFYLIETRINDTFYEKCLAKYKTKDENLYKKLDLEYQELLKELENPTYIASFKKQIKELEDRKKDISDENLLSNMDIQIEALKYRIALDIPVTYNSSSQLVDTFYTSGLTVNEFKDRKKLSKGEIKKQKQALKEYNESKYKLDRAIKSGKSIDFYTKYNFAKDITSITTEDMFVIIFIVIALVIIISDEFTRGTIKELMILPFSRSKILLSKMISLFIVFTCFILFYLLIETIGNSYLYGTFDILKVPVVIYDLTAEKIINLNVFAYFGLSFVANLPYYIIIALIAMLAGIIVPNSIAVIGTGLGVTFGSVLLESLSSKWVSYLPIVNSQFSDFLFGGTSSLEGGSLAISLSTNFIFIVVLLILIFVIFNRKDISNQ